MGAAPEADEAVAWALRHAHRHRTDVRLVRAYESGDLWPGGVACALGVPRAGLRDVLARSTLTRARRIAREAGQPDDDDPVVDVREGSAVEVLLAASRDASMVVVGHRKRPGAALWGFGSVALGVLHHAHAPVTVVCSASDDGPVVVGVDGSSNAFTALRHALADAAARRVRTIVVAAGTTVSPAWAHAQVEDASRRVTDAGVTPGTAEVVAVDEPAARALIETAERHRAALVVVGHRGRGHLTSAVLGSVGEELVARAPLPVTVVRTDEPSV